MKSIEKIKEILTWYYKSGSTASIDQLIKKQDELAVWSCNLAEYCGELKGQYNRDFFIRKIEVLKEKQNLINAGSAIGKADADALIEKEMEFRQELESETNAYKADILLKQVNKVLSSFQQRIAYARQEFDNKNMQQG